MYSNTLLQWNVPRTCAATYKLIKTAFKANYRVSSYPYFGSEQTSSSFDWINRIKKMNSSFKLNLKMGQVSRL